MTNPLFDLTGRTALVTGSARGIGLAIAQGLGESGAAVVVNGRQPATVEAAVARLTQRGLQAQGAVFDVADEAAVTAAFEAFDAQGLHIDILVNNAGIQHRAPMLDLALKDWQRVIDTNLTAAFLVGKAAARRMVARGQGGKILNIGSLTSEAARATAVQHPGEFDRAGLHPDRHERGADPEPGLRRLGQGQQPGATLGPPGGAGRHGGVPRLGRLELRQRPDHLRRWRLAVGAVTEHDHPDTQAPESAPAPAP
jgi:NAD(P)-dependent dehydrogenase (short-subunit alcohol dehydrogenase family)